MESLTISKETNNDGIDIDNLDIAQELTQYDDFDVIYTHHVLVRLYIKDNTFGYDINGRKTSIYMPENSINQSIYTNCSGLIIKMGPEAYQGKSFDDKVVPKIGDWVLIPRSEGLQCRYKNRSMLLIEDFRLMTAKINDPRLFSK